MSFFYNIFVQDPGTGIKNQKIWKSNYYPNESWG